MNKSDLRKQILEKLKSVTEFEKKNIELRLKENLLESSYWKNASTIGITMSQSHEWNTSSIIESGWLAGKKMCIPKCHPATSQLDFYQLSSYNQLESVYYNLLEPKINDSVKFNKNELDMIIVPGLLFDLRGFRIGYGGGYYDRYLSDYNGVTIALASNQQIVTTIPSNPHDIPVQHLITETGNRL